ncbi:MAG: hypothetical protein ACJ8AW_03420 [Rhodopila sp.]
MTQQPKSQRIWRVTLLEWPAHVTIIEADTAELAEAEARRLWENHGEHEQFHFSDSGLDGVVVKEAFSDPPE